MKTKIFLPLLAALGMIALLPSCEDDYADATSAHVYGEHENPPLKGADSSNASHNMSIQMGDTQTYTLNLADYAPVIASQLGEDIDAVFAGLESGKYRFMMVNPQRRQWDKSAANAGDDAWYISGSGICTSQENAYAVVRLDRAARTVSYNLTEAALPGTIIPATVGIAKTDDSAFPVNFRLANKITVADLSVISTSITVPEGDYASEVIDLSQYLANFEYTFGISDVQTISDGMDPNGKHLFDLYMMGDNGRYGTPPDGYTANNGYWLNSQMEICAWGADNFSYFIEQYFGDDGDGTYIELGFGRAPGLAPQEKDFTVVLAWAKDPNKALTFLVHVTFE